LSKVEISVAKKFTLGKDERLKSRKQIDQLFAKGQKFSSGFFRVFFLIKNAGGPTLQFGITVSNKIFKKAVDRNKIKRLGREAWRLQKNELKEKLSASGKQMNIFLVYTSKTIATYAEVAEAIQKIISKLYKNSSDPG